MLKKNICSCTINYFLMMVLIYMMLINDKVYALGYDNTIADEHKDVIIVNNEKQLIKQVVRVLIDHKHNVTLSYPGIVKKFKKYRKKGYVDFFERLSIENGYYTGIISGYCVNIDNDSVTFQFNYMTSEKQERYIRKVTRKLAKKYKGKSTYEKIKAAHDYLTAHMVYDSRYCSPYYALKKGRGICMSYSLAFQRILQEMKVPCIYVKGDDHAWNLVRIKGRWYGVDVTWDDAGGTYKYFLKGTSDFPGHKLPDNKCYKHIKMAKRSYIY